MKHGVFGIEFIETEGFCDEVGMVFVEASRCFPRFDEKVEFFTGDGRSIFRSGDSQEPEDKFSGSLKEPRDGLDDGCEDAERASHDPESGFWELEGEVFGDEFTKNDKGECDDKERDNGENDWRKCAEDDLELSGDPLFEHGADSDAEYSNPDLNGGDRSGLIFGKAECKLVEGVSFFCVGFKSADAAGYDGVFGGNKESRKENK